MRFSNLQDLLFSTVQQDFSVCYSRQFHQQIQFPCFDSVATVPLFLQFLQTVPDHQFAFYADNKILKRELN